MSKKHFLCGLLMALLCLPVFAQIQEPVKFKTEWITISDTEAEIVFTGEVEDGWHIYSTDLPEGGPISATFNVDKIEGAEVVGKLMPRGTEIDKMDPIFQMQVRYFAGTATFVQKIKIVDKNYNVTFICTDAVLLQQFKVAFPRFMAVSVVGTQFVPDVKAVHAGVTGVQTIPCVFFCFPEVFYCNVRGWDNI